MKEILENIKISGLIFSAFFAYGCMAFTSFWIAHSILSSIFGF